MFSRFQCILIPRWPQDGLKMVARGPKMDPGGSKMAQDGPKRSHIHEICDSYTLLPPPEALLVRRSARNLVFYHTNRGGDFSRACATNCEEARRIGGVGPLNTTNTLQTGKEHSNTPQRAEGTVADQITYTV